MKKQITNSIVKLWLSSNDTYLWANRCWPCSQLSGKRLFIEYDSNGLLDITVNGKPPADVDTNELNAIVADHVLVYEYPDTVPDFSASANQPNNKTKTNKRKVKS